MRSVRPLAQERGVEIELSSNGAVGECEADGERLLRACENVLRNAVRHARQHIEVATSLEDDEVHIRVRDDGPGFDGGADRRLTAPVECLGGCAQQRR